MTSLYFDYNPDSGSYEAAYRGLTIRAERDETPTCPWDDWDGCQPLLVESYDYRSKNRKAYGGYETDLDWPLRWTASDDDAFRAAWPAICAAFREIDLETDAQELLRYWDSAHDSMQSVWSELWEARLEAYNEAIGEASLDELAGIWTALGVPAATRTSRGYCQGDQAELLIVLTPEFGEKIGLSMDELSKRAESEFDSAERLWSAWAWGDVYGFVIETDEDDHADSCWGFYGDDFEWSGLADAAKEAADSLIWQSRKARANRLKELIRARVPFPIRSNELSGFPIYGGAS